MKKGQAAVEFEFLMTYGWAILAAIIAIAVLTYFGVFSPGKYSQQPCLDDYAKQYCESQNLSFYERYETQFSCLEPSHIRDIEPKIQRFKYLPEELADCRSRQ